MISDDGARKAEQEVNHAVFRSIFYIHISGNPHWNPVNLWKIS